MSGPILSVLMTSYNREQFIAEAIDSVLACGFEDFELIILDDGSRDRTVEIARSYEARDTRVKLFINEKNLGDYPNRNRAATYARGEFIMYVDSDDCILPGSFAKCVDAMRQFPDAGMAMEFKGTAPGIFYQDPETCIKTHFFKEPSLMIGPGGTILRRRFFESIGKYPEKYGPANDMYFNLKAAARGGMLFLPFKIVEYRIHEGQESKNVAGYIHHNYRYMQDALKELSLPLTEKEKNWLDKKNKRRFITNMFHYLRRYRQPATGLHILKQSGFGIRDLVQGLFH